MDTILFFLELLGVVAFALSGAMLAIRKGMDILGVCVMGATTAVGGGILRDLMLGITPPSTLLNPTYALIAIGVSLFVFLPFAQRFLVGRSHKIYEWFVLIADSIGLGIFSVMGVGICYDSYPNASILMATFLGVITGVGGGVLRDVMSQSKPYILVKHFYACASIIGALLCALLRPWLGVLPAAAIGSAVIFGLRILAAIFRWELPKYPEVFPEKK
ncbi:MAG: trimeric intracellular cation channel family protein [Ruminococcaceae bacterium]|nr:trimeric intracellular cation channel family protein [Oscillospiraceae bacterium]